jgi:hypothetical protein
MSGKKGNSERFKWRGQLEPRRSAIFFNSNIQFFRIKCEEMTERWARLSIKVQRRGVLPALQKQRLFKLETFPSKSASFLTDSQAHGRLASGEKRPFKPIKRRRGKSENEGRSFLSLKSSPSITNPSTGDTDRLRVGLKWESESAKVGGFWSCWVRKVAQGGRRNSC